MQVMPQVLVYQQFTLIPSAIILPLRAFIFGPDYYVHTYAKSKSDCYVGVLPYPSVATDFDYPEHEATETVDTSTVVVNIDDAYIVYYKKSAGGTAVDPVSPNVVRMGGSAGWTEVTVGATTYSRITGLARDVAIGDYVRITDSGDATNTLVAKVRGLAQAVVASTHATSSTVDTSNKATTTGLSTKITEPDGTPFTSSCTTTAYKPYKVGVTSDRYTFTITKAGATGVAEMSVETDSGLDSDSSVVITIGAPTAFGDLGLTITFAAGTTFVLGDVWVFDVRCDFAAPAGSTLTIAGTYTGEANTTYTAEVLTGGVVGTDSPTWIIRTTTGIDAGGPYNATAAAVSVGAYGLTLAVTAATKLCKGDRFTFTATAATVGRMSDLLLDTSIPAALLALSDVDVSVQALRNLVLTEHRYNVSGVYNYVAGASKVTINSGITSYLTDEPDLNGYEIRHGSVYVGYKALCSEWANDIQTISDVADLGTYFEDITPDNPLAFGVKKALENSNGTDVKFVSVATNDLAGYTAAVNLTTSREDVYSFVPLTQDAAIKNMVAGHVDAQSTPEKGRWRIAWLTFATPTTAGIETVNSDGEVEVATILHDTADVAGTYRLVTATKGKFLTNAVREGDEYRYNYGKDSFGETTYSTDEVDSVISETQLKLLTGPVAAVNTAAKNEIWRTLTAQERAAAHLLENTYASRRVYVPVLGGQATMDGYALQPDYYVACCFAGLRSGVAPHQGLTNVAVSGIDALSIAARNIGDDALTSLMNAGLWAVTQSRTSGEIYCFKEVSSDMTDINSSEQMVTTNVDSISYYLKTLLVPYIGRANNVDSVQALIRGDIEAGFEYFFNNTKTPLLGAQILDGTKITALRTHATLPDRLVIEVSLAIPYALNNIEIYLVV